MKRLITAAIIALVLAVAPASAQVTPDHAITPQPTNKQFYCTAPGRDAMVPCWCDVWIHYPICRRWHWHP